MYVSESVEILELDNLADSTEIIDCRILKASQVACQGLQGKFKVMSPKNPTQQPIKLYRNGVQKLTQKNQIKSK